MLHWLRFLVFDDLDWALFFSTGLESIDEKQCTTFHKLNRSFLEQIGSFEVGPQKLINFSLRLSFPLPLRQLYLLLTHLPYKLRKFSLLVQNAHLVFLLGLPPLKEKPNLLEHLNTQLLHQRTHVRCHLLQSFP